MANENMAEWKPAPGVVIETVKAAKDFIEAELAKYGSWEEVAKVSVCGHLFETSASFAQAKGEQGIGIRQIHAFLGHQWSRYLIENTLSVIRQEETAARKKAERHPLCLIRSKAAVTAPDCQG